MPMLRDARVRERTVDRLSAFDARIDTWFDAHRRPRLDPLFFGLSSAADHGLLWLLIGAAKAAKEGEPAIAARMATVLTLESILTNGAIKFCFRRVRPEHEEHATGPLPYGMHRPISSSFPSGHAVSGFMAAMLLADSAAAPLWFGLATAVAASRIYVRMHHASDVVAGAALGVALGALARKVLPVRPRR